MIKFILLYFPALIFVLSCSSEPKEAIVSQKPHVLLPEVSATLPPFPASPGRNPLTKEGVELGRMLFYEKGLSANGTISCASCHIQSMAFSDGAAGSTSGQHANRLPRNTPALINLAWMQSFFWDGGAKNLESIAFAPLVHPDEMGQDLKKLVEWLQQHPYYPAMFKKAFGSDSVTSANVARALAQFQRTFISDNAKYDQEIKGKARYSVLEQKGKALFNQHCASCHTPGTFTDNEYHNIGLESHFEDTTLMGLYQGRYRITEHQKDLGKFKTPTLRNISLTAPYMHDGRFASLEQVLEHYASGMKKSATIDAIFQQENDQYFLPLDKEQQKAIIGFLHTLTDSSFITAPKLADPFALQSSFYIKKNK